MEREGLIGGVSLVREYLGCVNNSCTAHSIGVGDGMWANGVRVNSVGGCTGESNWEGMFMQWIQDSICRQECADERKSRSSARGVGLQRSREMAEFALEVRVIEQKLVTK